MTTERFGRGELAGYHVLVVEDEPDAGEMLAEFLTSVAVEVSAAADAREALAVFGRKRPDLIVSDLQMPGGGGFELIEELRRLPFEEGGLTPAIAMTAGPDTEADALLRGFHGWFPKPLDLIGLLDAIRSFARVRVTGDHATSANATVVRTSPGVLQITCVGHTRAVDARMMIRAVRAHLERGPQRIVVDLRQVTGFDLEAPYVAQHDVWSHRRAVEGVHLVGGTLGVRLAARAACAVLGLHCTVGDTMPVMTPTEK